MGTAVSVLRLRGVCKGFPLFKEVQVQGENPELWTGDVWPDPYLVLTGMQGLHPSV